MASVEGASPYNQAIELFKRGFSAAEVAERCGISRSEAELILSLYRNSPTA
jgi:transcriptional regulator with XRE-family HTH domain